MSRIQIYGLASDENLTLEVDAHWAACVDEAVGLTYSRLVTPTRPLVRYELAYLIRPYFGRG